MKPLFIQDISELIEERPEVSGRAAIKSFPWFWVVAVTFLLLGLYWPILLWVALLVSLFTIGHTIITNRGRFSLLTLLVPVASLLALIRAGSDPDFGNAEHAAAVSNFYGWAMWYAVCALDLVGLFALILLTMKLNRQTIRDGGLSAVFACLFFVVALTVCLIATGLWNFSQFNLLWMTPITLIATGLFTYWLMRDAAGEATVEAVAEDEATAADTPEN